MCAIKKEEATRPLYYLKLYCFMWGYYKIKKPCLFLSQCANQPPKPQPERGRLAGGFMPPPGSGHATKSVFFRVYPLAPRAVLLYNGGEGRPPAFSPAAAVRQPTTTTTRRPRRQESKGAKPHEENHDQHRHDLHRHHCAPLRPVHHHQH